ncbi:MAG: NUDIX domain-containing protein [Phototrophicaceae bacterium]
MKKKVFAYITQNDRLLVFEQPDSPEAGIQVPAGSLEINETPEAGALREAQEETGLEVLSVVRFLGEQTRDMSDYDKQEIHHRYFYHLICEQDTPETWLHGERFPSDQPHHDGSITHLFRLYWVEIGQLPKLIADHDFYIEELSHYLRSD